MHGENCWDVMGLLGQRPESRGPDNQVQPSAPSRAQLGKVGEGERERVRVRKGLSFCVATLERETLPCPDNHSSILQEKDKREKGK